MNRRGLPGLYRPWPSSTRLFEAHFTDLDPAFGREYMCAEADAWVIAHHPLGARAPDLDAPQTVAVRIKRGFPTDFNPAGDDGGKILVRHRATARLCLLHYQDGIQTAPRKRSGILVTYKIQIVTYSSH